jgi:hypothetical protein
MELTVNLTIHSENMITLPKSDGEVGMVLPALDRHHWPKYSLMKEFSNDSRLTDKERREFPQMANDEWALQFLEKSVGQYCDALKNGIERMRSSKNLSLAKMSGFTARTQSAISFFNDSIAIFSRLAVDLLPERVHNQLNVVYSRNLEDFQAALLKFSSHFETHISPKTGISARNPRFQFGHLSKLRKLADEMIAKFSSTLAPLSLSFSVKLQPVIDKREAFFRSQKSLVAEKGGKVSQLKGEMEAMMERRKRLETGANHLDRMLEVLVKLKASVRVEEEEDSEETLPFL